MKRWSLLWMVLGGWVFGSGVLVAQEPPKVTREQCLSGCNSTRELQNALAQLSFSRCLERAVESQQICRDAALGGYDFCIGECECGDQEYGSTCTACRCLCQITRDGQLNTCDSDYGEEHATCNENFSARLSEISESFQGCINGCPAQ